MQDPTVTICRPDLCLRPITLTVERTIALPPEKLFKAWTQQLDLWFAAAGSVLMKAEVNSVFFFETSHQSEPDGEVRRHPHYGRFLKLIPDSLVELTWVTGVEGTKGAETVVTVELTPQGADTNVRLTHGGFPDEESRARHEHAWPFILEGLEQRLTAK